MTRPLTTLTQQDLRLYASQRLTDTTDGGGKMTNVQLTGKPNELFPPISDLAAAGGQVNARLIYATALKGVAAALWGANVIVRQPPQSSHVSFLLAKADYYGQSRASIMERIESYRVAATESRMTLLGTQRKGAKVVQAYQRNDAPIPVVGTCYALRYLDNGVAVHEFIRVETVSSELRTFEDSNGEFSRRVVTMTIPLALEHDFEGMEYPVRGKATPDARILDTQIADSAQYYGVKPLIAAVDKGSASVQVSSIYEQLVPVSVAETALADDWSAGREIWVETGAKKQLLSTFGSQRGSVYLPCPVLPGSIEISGWTDTAQGSLKNGDTRLTVDYANGVIGGLTGQSIGAIYGTPAVRVRNAAYTSVIHIDDTNVGTEWAPFLRPAPARGSVSVSYRAQGEWYELTDNGDYILRDATAAVRGSITKSGSCIISLPAVPDSGSQIIVQWVPHHFYQTLDGGAAGESIAPKNVTTQLVLPANPITNLVPGSVRLSWDGGTAQDNGQGQLTGDCTGTINYAAGTIYPVGLTVAKIHLTAKQYSQTAATKSVSVYGGGAPDADISLVVGELQRGSLNISLTGSLVTESNYRVRSFFVNVNDYYTNRTSGISVITDDGNGNILINGLPPKFGKGHVDYGTGRVVIPSNGMTATITKPRYVSNQITKGASNTIVYGGSIQESAAWFEPSATAAVSVITAADTRDVAQSISTGLQQYELLQGKPYPNAAVLNSWLFEIDGVLTYERGGVLYQNWQASDGTGDVVGSLSASGTLILTKTATAQQPIVKILAGVWVNGTYAVQQFYGRTAIAPIKPRSVTVYAEQNGTTLTGESDAEGQLSGSLKGSIDYATGYFAIEASEPIAPESLRYNAVSQQSIPINSTEVGINATRLPSDGRVPIYRAGGYIVISNQYNQDIGSAFTAGQVTHLDRADCDRIAVVDATGKHLAAELYEEDLNDSTIEWATPLDLSAYTLPLTAVQLWEEDNRVTGVSIDGKLKLQNPLRRAYPKDHTYVSSAVVGGDLIVRATEPFVQETWGKVWRDSLVGNTARTTLNVKDYPIVLTADGAVDARWRIEFTSANQFDVYEETMGLLWQGDTLTDVAPINPATDKPYFTLSKKAFGLGGWSAGNVIRFNTFGTVMGVWIIRAIQPTTEKLPESDGFTACLRGNTEILQNNT